MSTKYIGREIPYLPYVVTRIAILGGGHDVTYTAWESTRLMGDHSSLTSFDGKWYGQLGSRRLPEAEALQGGSPERIACYEAYRREAREIATALIASAFPEALRGVRSDTGQIRVNDQEIHARECRCFQ